MGMWDELEKHYPAPGSYAGADGVPPLGAPGVSALLKLIERGVAARGQATDDGDSAAQFARDAAAAGLARAVKPPYGRNEGWLTRAPEDWVRNRLWGPFSRDPAWLSPARPVSPMSAPLAATPLGDPPDDANRDDAQAERDAVATTAENAARHPYGKVFEAALPDNTSAQTENARQSKLAREEWARRLAKGVRRPAPPVQPTTDAPVETEKMRQAQAAREAGARGIANAAQPLYGRQMGPLTKYPEYAAEKAWELGRDAFYLWVMNKVRGRIFKRSPKP